MQFGTHLYYIYTHTHTYIYIYMEICKSLLKTGYFLLLRHSVRFFASVLCSFLLSGCQFPVEPCAPVAQWLEHCVSSAKVVGSIPREHMY